jgi:hypothetical protein
MKRKGFLRRFRKICAASDVERARCLIRIGALAPPIAFVTLPGFGDILGLRELVDGK